MSLSQAPGTINEESPALARARRQATDDVRCVAAAMHVLRFPLVPDESHYLVLKIERARSALQALADSLRFHSGPETEETLGDLNNQEDVAVVDPEDAALSFV